MTMRVYVETNFVLELALLQAEHECCSDILKYASSRQIELIVPAYSLVEPHETLSRRHAERMKMKTFLDQELTLLARSENYKDRLAERRAITEFLPQSRHEEASRLWSVQQSIMSASFILPLNSIVISASRKCEQDYGLKSQDSIVLASVLCHLREEQSKLSCFINRNPKDFEDPDIVDALKSLNCKLISSFSDGLRFIRSKLQQASDLPACPQTHARALEEGIGGEPGGA